MYLTRLLTKAALALALLPLYAELRPDQRRQDFIELATLFWKQYGPYEWKKEILDFDLANLRPWLARVEAARSDMEFAEICIEYVNSTKDGHVFLTIPSSYQPFMNISVDIYDGKPLVEAVNTANFPPARFPIRIGDEVVSIDGKPTREVIESLKKFTGFGSNARSEERIAANFLFNRPQSRFPWAANIPDTSVVVFRHADGGEETLTMPWTKFSEPLRDFGKLPPFAMSRQAKVTLAKAGRGAEVEFPEDVKTQPWLKDLLELGYSAAPRPPFELPDRGLLGYGGANPVWAPPAGFVQRLTAADIFVSGVYSAGGKRIGYIRLRNMAPPSIALALQVFEREMAFFQENTDGLVVDVMRNTGGFIVYGHEIARRLIPRPIRGIGFELRATASRYASISAALGNARLSGAPQWTIDHYQDILKALSQALSEDRGRTGPIPLDMPSLEAIPPASVVYTKPLIVLIDEFSVSTADLFPAVMQDNNRGVLVGMRTAGLGGTNGSFGMSPSFMEATTGVTFGLMVRPRAVAWEKGTTNYIENVGVRPDFELDYMTRENLLNQGRPFVNAFTNILLDQIHRGATN